MNFSPMSPVLRTFTLELRVMRTPRSMPNFTFTPPGRSEMSSTLPMFTPFTEAGSPVARPPTSEKRTLYTRRLRARRASESHVTPQMTSASAPITAMPTRISVLRPAMPSLPVAAARSVRDRESLASPFDERAHDGILGVPDLVRRSHGVHAPLVQVRDAVTDEVGARHIVRHHDRREPVLFLQAADQAVDDIRHHRIEPGRGLVV